MVFFRKKSCRTIQVACCMCVPLLRHVYPTWWLMEVSFLKLNLFGFQHVTLQNTAFPTLAKGKTSSSKVPLKNQGRFLFPKQSLFFAGLKTFLTLTRRKSHQVASFCNIEEDLPTEDRESHGKFREVTHSLPGSWLTETENGSVEAKYYAFRWLDTLIII